MKTIKELQKEIHQNAKDKGFWKDGEGILETLKLARLLYNKKNSTNFNSSEDERTVINLIISQKLMLIVSELGESLESLRSNKRSVYQEELADSYLEDILQKYTAKGFEENIKNTFEDELADSVIRILDLAGWLGIDLETHIKLKMEYNKTRDIKHNKEF